MGSKPQRQNQHVRRLNMKIKKFKAKGSRGLLGLAKDLRPVVSMWCVRGASASLNEGLLWSRVSCWLARLRAYSANACALLLLEDLYKRSIFFIVLQPKNTQHQNKCICL